MILLLPCTLFLGKVLKVGTASIPVLPAPYMIAISDPLVLCSAPLSGRSALCFPRTE